jgi:translation initiation factor eIF-2B subunit epsilon
VVTYTNTFVATNIFQRIILSSLPGKFTSFILRTNADCDGLIRTCKIGNNTLIGPCTHIHENVEISESVIGQNCVIGAGTVIRRSYIFDGTAIGSQCVIERSIIGANVNIKNGTRVNKGSLIGDGVIVGPSAVLGPFERLSRRRDANDATPDGDEEEEVDSDLEDVEASMLWSD